jgi:hypothetical protein
VPSNNLIPSLLALSDVMGTGWFAADAANVKPGAMVAVVGGHRRGWYQFQPANDCELAVNTPCSLGQRFTPRAGASLIRGDGSVQDTGSTVGRESGLDQHESGLKALAFHPRFAENGRFLVNCTLRDKD